jgi:PAS domain S-box-containing protein
MPRKQAPISCERCLATAGVMMRDGYWVCVACDEQLQEVIRQVVRQDIEKTSTGKAAYRERKNHVVALARQHGVLTSDIVATAMSWSKTQAITYLHTLAKRGTLEFMREGRFKLHPNEELAQNLVEQGVQARRWFNSLFRESSQLVSLFSLSEMKLVEGTAGTRKLFGYGEGELSPTELMTIFHEDDRPKLQRYFEQALEEGHATVELRVFSREGRLLHIESNAFLIQREPEILLLVAHKVQRESANERISGTPPLAADGEEEAS